MARVDGFIPFSGKHCESTATGNLLRHAGVDLSEAMMVGLGEAFGFIIWKMKIMNLPFIGGRSRQFALTTTLCEHLGLSLDARETGSKKKAWENLADCIDSGRPAGLQLDFYYLDYVRAPIHFPGHFLCVYGYDDKKVWVVDTDRPSEGLTLSRESLEKARHAKGPMSAKARSWSIKKTAELPALRDIIPTAIQNTAEQFLKPPIQNFGFKGIEKLAGEITGWLELAPDPARDLEETASVMEGGGTGGAIFRNFYRDFLKECLEYLPGNETLEYGRELFARSATNWTRISELISIAGRSGERAYLEEAGIICRKTASIEKEAMERLAAL